MPADIKAPGLVRHPSKFQELFVGEVDGIRSKRVDDFVDAVKAAGITGIVAEDIRATLWEKFVMQSAFSGLTTLTRLDIGPIRENPATRALLEAGADKVIATSCLFDRETAAFRPERLEALAAETGRDRLVVDLSCRERVAEDGTREWVVAMNRWQTPTDFVLAPSRLSEVAGFCDELLIHAADVEGKCEGIDKALVAFLGEWGECPITYAGGARSLEDLSLVETLSGGKVDLTIGSALDLFGGKLIAYDDCVAFNRRASDPVTES